MSFQIYLFEIQACFLICFDNYYDHRNKTMTFLISHTRPPSGKERRKILCYVSFVLYWCFTLTYPLHGLIIIICVELKK